MLHNDRCEKRRRMKIIVFGTGRYYQIFKKYIKSEDIVCFIDNDNNKQGTVFDGKRVQSPYETDYTQCDYVLVLILENKEVFSQLLSLGIEKEKIKSFYDIGQLYNIEVKVREKVGTVSLSEWGRTSADKKVLIVSHELSRTGVPVVLMHMAILLKKMGYRPLIVSLVGGGLEEELTYYGIDFVPDIGLCYKSDCLKDIVKRTEFVLLGTVVVADIADSIKNIGTPLLYWMHESSDKMFRDFPLPFGDNIYYYGGGQRVIHFFNKYYPQRRIQKLLYFLPDEEKIHKKAKKGLRVSIIGSIHYRKAQDIFVEAIRLIPEEKRCNVEFEIVGAVMQSIINIDSVVNELPQVHYIGELTQEELRDYFATIDLLVCPSRDDPMPVVVTQAMQYSIPCIVSDQVGQSEYIENGINGYVFKSEDVKDLSRLLENCIDFPEKMKSMGIRSYEIYRKYFSEQMMEEKLREIINKIVI